MTLTHSYLRVSIQHRFISTCLCAILYGARETKSVHIISVMTLRVVGTRALSGARSCGHPPRCRVLYVFNAFEFRLTFFRTRENRRESQKRMVCYEFFGEVCGSKNFRLYSRPRPRTTRPSVDFPHSISYNIYYVKYQSIYIYVLSLFSFTLMTLPIHKIG